MASDQKEKEKSEYKILAATYGSSDVRLVVTAHVRLFGYNNTLSRSMAPNFFWHDPCPLTTKKLVLMLGQEEIEEKGKQGIKIVETSELLNKWIDPVYLDSSTVIAFTGWGGFSNQIYCAFSAALAAAKSHRALAFPWEFMARTGADGDVSSDGVWEKARKLGYLVPFSHLLDEAHFRRYCGLRLLPVPIPIPMLPASSFSSAAATTAKIATMALPRCSANELAGHCLDEDPVILLRSPFDVINIQTREELKLVTRMLRAMIPTPRLMSVATSILSSLEHVKKTEEMKQKKRRQQKKKKQKKIAIAVVHWRIESDWGKVFPKHVISPEQLADIVSCHGECGLPRGSIIYLMGGLETRHAQLMQSACPEYTWLSKQELLQQPQTIEKKLGFEEGAVVDREVALRADHFIGFRSSTLSLLVAIERQTLQKPFFLYRHNDVCKDPPDCHIRFFVDETGPLQETQLADCTTLPRPLSSVSFPKPPPPPPPPPS